MGVLHALVSSAGLQLQEEAVGLAGGEVHNQQNGHCISSQLWTQRPHVQTGMLRKDLMVLLQLKNKALGP